jgi:PAS domain S-box-containing protein
MKENTATGTRDKTGISALPDIIERITDGVFAVDTYGYFTFVNARAAEIFRINSGEITGKLAWDYVPDNPEKQFYQACQQAMSEQKYKCQECYFQTADQWNEYHIYPSPAGISVLFRDISDRKKAEEEWKRTELRFHALIEQASDAIMITDFQGNFLEVNSTLCRMFGYSREELLKSNIAYLLDPEELKMAPIQFALLASGQAVLRERRMLHKDGSIIEVEANVKRTPDGRLLAIARDITERKRAAQQVLKEKEISDSIINSLPGAFLIREIGGGIIRWNKQLEEISGYSPEEIPHLPPYHFFEEDNKEYMRQRVSNLLVNEKSSFEVIIVTKEGKRLPFFLTAMIMVLEEKPCLVVIGFDISERKAVEDDLQTANEQLRHLSAHLQHVREEERKTIALEIHDELGQQLTALKMDLSWAMKKSARESIIYGKMSDMNKLVDHTISTVRRISSELRPSILDDLGLAEALDWQSAEFEKRYGINTRFHCSLTDLKISPDIVTGLFRIYQESLTNVARHAKADNVWGSLELENDHVILQVKDNGKGFDTQTAGNKGTFGLIGIKERTHMMGGRYTILSSQNKGTTITVSVPIQTNKEASV